jgi:hypothetical protein
MARVIRGVEVDVVGHDYEYSPDINLVGYAYVTATDMDGKPFELTDEETEQLTTELSQEYENDAGLEELGGY